MIRIIRTRYFGATDNQGSRIIATDLKTGTKLVQPWDYGFDEFNQHTNAADKLNARLRGTPGANTAKYWYGAVEDSKTHERYHAFDRSDEP